MHRLQGGFLLLVLVYLLSSCMSTRLVAFNDSFSIQSQQITRVTLFWGILQPKDIPAACDSKSICKVSAKTNIGYILVSALTLGAVVPQQIIWDCCPPNIPEEKLD